MKNKNIVGVPDDRLNDLTISFFLDNKLIKFDILTNVKENEMNAVIHSWTARTNDFTDKSLVNYINSKSQYGFKAKIKPL